MPRGQAVSLPVHQVKTEFSRTPDHLEVEPSSPSQRLPVLHRVGLAAAVPEGPFLLTQPHTGQRS
jgi:hypothetical protein